MLGCNPEGEYVTVGVLGRACGRGYNRELLERDPVPTDDEFLAAMAKVIFDLVHMLVNNRGINTGEDQ